LLEILNMRIGIDIRCLQTTSQYRGIGFYTYNLLLHLAKLDKVNEYFLFAFKGKELNISLPENMSKNLCFLPNIKNLRQLAWLPDTFTSNKEIEKYNLDIFHFTSPFEFFFGFDFRQKTKFKKAVTLYDLIPAHYPNQTFSGLKILLKPCYFYLLKSARFTNKIITISRFSEEDLISKLNIPKDKISVAYPGINEKFTQDLDKNSLENIRKKYELPPEFLLYVGAANPNKNLPFLINTVKQLQLPLVIAGHKSKKNFETLEKEIGHQKNIHLLGFIIDNDMPYIYKLAKIFVFPSLYEGFGMPPLEALASGVPVIASNTSSLPEVVGNAGILIDPRDEASWIREIKNLWENENLRKELSVSGQEQAKKFSWEKTARETIKAYQEMIKK